MKCYTLVAVFRCTIYVRLMLGMAFQFIEHSTAKLLNAKRITSQRISAVIESTEQ